MRQAIGNSRRRRPAGFTLIELLVVIAIIVILIALLVPAVQKVRAAAARTQCANNMKQLALGLHSFYDNKRYFPPDRITLTGPTAPPNHSWAAHVLPYIEQKNLFDSYNFKKNWDDTSNYSAVRTQISTFNCPIVPTGMRVDTRLPLINPA